MNYTNNNIKIIAFEIIVLNLDEQDLLKPLLSVV